MPRTLSPAARIERSILSDFRKPLWRPFVRGIKQYKMIAPGDHIAVCISGGKDSMLLAKMMQLLQRHTATCRSNSDLSSWIPATMLKTASVSSTMPP